MKFEIDACSPVIGDLLYELEVASWVKLADQVARRIYSSLKSKSNIKLRLSGKLRVLLQALNSELPIDIDNFYCCPSYLSALFGRGSSTSAQTQASSSLI